MRLWYFPSSVNSFFKRACAVIQCGLVGPFAYFHTVCVRTGKALARLHECAGSAEPSLVACVISTIISGAGSNHWFSKILNRRCKILFVFYLITTEWRFLFGLFIYNVNIYIDREDHCDMKILNNCKMYVCSFSFDDFLGQDNVKLRGALSVKCSTNVIMSLKYCNFLPLIWKELLIVVTLNVKMV